MIVNVQPDDLVGLFCANMDAFPNVVAILVKLIFMTPDWTKLHNLLVLEKCLDYTWLQFKENETSTIFTNIESVFETSIRNFLHDRHSQRESQHSSKWHSLTTEFTKLMEPSVDDRT